MSDWFLSTLTPEQRARSLQSLERYREASRGLFEDLSALGYEAPRLSSLGVAVTNARPVVMVLWRWYEESDYPELKRNILSTLGEKWARQSAMPLLIAEFAQFEGPSDPHRIAFSLGDAIGRQLVTDNFESVLDLVADESKGVARSSLVYALASVPKQCERARPALISLLRDPTAAPFAADALGRLKAVEALPALEKCARTHPDEQARKAAELAVTKLSKSLQE